MIHAEGKFANGPELRMKVTMRGGHGEEDQTGTLGKTRVSPSASYEQENDTEDTSGHGWPECASDELQLF